MGRLSTTECTYLPTYLNEPLAPRGLRGCTVQKKTSMILSHTKTIGRHRRAHGFAQLLKKLTLQFSPILSVDWLTIYCRCFPPLNVEMLLTKLQC